MMHPVSEVRRPAGAEHCFKKEQKVSDISEQQEVFVIDTPSNPYNPYQSPQAEISVERNDNTGGLSETALRYLKEAAPWLRFIGVMGFIACGLSAVIGLIVFIATQVMPENALFGSSGVVLRASGSGSGLFLIGFAVLWFFPARFIYAFGTRLRNYLKNNAETELELAFKNNKSFWKFMGITLIVELAFIPLIIVITIVVMSSQF
jgi:hypothetical protein